MTNPPKPRTASIKKTVLSVVEWVENHSWTIGTLAAGIGVVLAPVREALPLWSFLILLVLTLVFLFRSWRSIQNKYAALVLGICLLATYFLVFVWTPAGFEGRVAYLRRSNDSCGVLKEIRSAREAAPFSLRLWYSMLAEGHPCD